MWTVTRYAGPVREIVVAWKDRGRVDLTPVQALLVYNLGGSEVSAGELRSRGMYQGSNVSYNLKKLVQMGYVHHQRCEQDRRSVRVRLTDDGTAVRDIVGALFARHADGLDASGILDDPPLEQQDEDHDRDRDDHGGRGHRAGRLRRRPDREAPRRPHDRHRRR